MIVTCQACGASNDDQARFCDQCGAPLAGALNELEAPAAPLPPPLPAAPAAAAPRGSDSTVNVWGLAAIAVVLTALGLLFFGKGGGTAQQPPPEGGSAAAGAGGDQGMQMFEQAQAELKKHKDALTKDPADATALGGMYSLYSQIGQVEKVRPYLDTALAEVEKQLAAGKLTQQAATKRVLDLSMAAMQGDAAVDAVDCLKVYYQLNPKRVSTALMIANIYYDVGMPAEGVEWYEKYLGVADPVEDGSDIRGAKVDLETLRMALAQRDRDKGMLAKAVANLEAATRAYPDFWAAQFNLGQAYLQQGDKQRAVRTWQHALALAHGEEETWRCNAAIAEAQGQPVPEPPAGIESPASSTDPSLNPHAEQAAPPPGERNPHDGRDAAGMDPHGEPDPHGSVPGGS
jgi:tetratricopeptide (TPR) repeat protein